jgi:hypothetical protein
MSKKDDPIYKKLILKDIGIYNIKISKDFQLQSNRTKKEIGIILNIGGVGKNCVQINVPYEGNKAHLMWIEAAYGCSLTDTEQRGDLLINMTNAGIHIAKTYNPQLQTIELQDSASFNCKLPNGDEARINSTQHDLAFYQKSYYEKKYGAVLSDDIQQEEYNKRKSGFLNPLSKPSRFIFGPQQMNDELALLYTESTTWKEFFDKINTTYKKNKCAVISMWLSRAVTEAMGMNYSGQVWKIDINTIEKPDYALTSYTEENYITYEKYGLKKYLETNILRGGRRTRKQLKKKEANWREMYEMDWKGYFQEIKKADDN